MIFWDGVALVLALVSLTVIGRSWPKLLLSKLFGLSSVKECDRLRGLNDDFPESRPPHAACSWIATCPSTLFFGL